MHIAVLEVLYPIHRRAVERLGRRYVVGYTDITLTTMRSGPVRPSSVYTKCFATQDALLANLKEKLVRRFYHGYVLIWWSESFPLLDWIHECEYPVETRTVLTPAIQLELPLRPD